MTCESFNINGNTAIVCSRGRRVAKCGCGNQHTLLCDFPAGKNKTCDKRLCPNCSNHVGPNTDYCRSHPTNQVQGELSLNDIAMSLVSKK